MSAKKRIARTEEEWLADPSLEMGWETSQSELDRRKRKREELHRLIGRTEEPLLAELRSIGMVVDSVWDLLRQRPPWGKVDRGPLVGECIAVVIKGLGPKFVAPVKEGIARSLIGYRQDVIFEAVAREFEFLATPEGKRDECDRFETVVSGLLREYDSEAKIRQYVSNRVEGYIDVIAMNLGFNAVPSQIPRLATWLDSADIPVEMRSSVAYGIRDTAAPGVIDDKDIRRLMRKLPRI